MLREVGFAPAQCVRPSHLFSQEVPFNFAERTQFISCIYSKTGMSCLLDSEAPREKAATF